MWEKSLTHRFPPGPIRICSHTRNLCLIRVVVQDGKSYFVENVSKCLVGHCVSLTDDIPHKPTKVQLFKATKDTPIEPLRASGKHERNALALSRVRDVVEMPCHGENLFRRQGGQRSRRMSSAGGDVSCYSSLGIGRGLDAVPREQMAERPSLGKISRRSTSVQVALRQTRHEDLESLDHALARQLRSNCGDDAESYQHILPPNLRGLRDAEIGRVATTSRQRYWLCSWPRE